MANDAIDPTDSTFEDHWDKLESKLNEWVKSSLPGIVTKIMQSHVINFDAAGLETQLGSSEKKVKRTNKFKSSKESQTG